MNDYVAIAVFGIAFFLFLTMWIASTWLLGAFGGWAQLAKRFPCAEPPQGTRWRARSIVPRKLFPANYNNCINIVANEQGIGIATMFIFRTGHAPLFIPWSAVLISEIQRFYFFKMARLDFPEEPGVSIELPMGLAKKIEQAVGHDWFSDDDGESAETPTP